MIPSPITFIIHRIKFTFHERIKDTQYFSLHCYALLNVVSWNQRRISISFDGKSKFKNHYEYLQLKYIVRNSKTQA